MEAKYKYPKDSSRKKYKNKESKEKKVKKRKNKSKEKKEINKRIPKRNNLLYYDSDNTLDEESSFSKKNIPIQFNKGKKKKKITGLNFQKRI